MLKKTRFSHVVSIFHGWRAPEREIQLVGYAALIETFDLKVPLPDRWSAIGHKHKKYQENQWAMFSPRHLPELTLFGHLTFALKYEGVNLLVLKALFDVIDPLEIINIIRLEPSGSYSRRIWFLYEWLQGGRLDI